MIGGVLPAAAKRGAYDFRPFGPEIINFSPRSARNHATGGKGAGSCGLANSEIKKSEGTNMQKTEHYQLNQWDRTDRILMEDFNGDNARIDAALAALLALSTSESARLDAAVAASEKRSQDALSAARTALQGDIKRLDTGKLRFEVLLEKSLSASGSSSLNLPVSGSVLSQCVLAAVDVQVPSSGSCYLGINGSTGSHWTPSFTSGTVSGGLAMLQAGRLSRLVFFPMKRAATPVTCIMAGGSLYLGYSTLTYSSISYLQLRDSNGNNMSGTVSLRVSGIL